MILRRGIQSAAMTRRSVTTKERSSAVRNATRVGGAASGRRAGVRRLRPRPHVGALGRAGWPVGSSASSRSPVPISRPPGSRPRLSGRSGAGGQIAITLSLVVAYQGELSKRVGDPRRLRAVSRRRLTGTSAPPAWQSSSISRARSTPHGRSCPARSSLIIASDDQIGELRSVSTSARSSATSEDSAEARAHLERAIALAVVLDQTMIGALAQHNMAHVETLSGDLPAAFESFERAARGYSGSGYIGPYTRQLKLDHARALLQANLLDEAREVGRSSSRGVGTDRGRARSGREPARRRRGSPGQRRRHRWGRGGRTERRRVHGPRAAGVGSPCSLGGAAGARGRPSDVGTRRRAGGQRRRARIVRLPHGVVAGDAPGGGGACRAGRRRRRGRAHEGRRQVGPGVGRPPAGRAARAGPDRTRPRQAAARAAGGQPRRAHPPRAPCGARRDRAARPRRGQQ